MPGKTTQPCGDIETLPLASVIKTGLRVKPVDADRIFCVVVWMAFSSLVVIYNKWVFSRGGFPYPLTLTAMHMTSCFAVFGSIRKFAPDSIRLYIMPDADVPVPWPLYLRNFLAISFFYAGTLGTGNLAYLFSSVAFVQMMKPMNCICASVAAFVVGMESPTTSHLIIVSVIAFGVVFATNHSAQFSMTGCLLQIVSSCSEGCRLALVQTVTTSGMKLDPVTTVYHFSFASAVLLGGSAVALEWPLNFSKLVSPWLLVLNCAMALILNVLVAIVIKKTSAVVFALSGIVKDMGIIAASSLFFATKVTPLMLCGYTISILGLCMYKAYKDNFDCFQQHGFLGGMAQVVMAATRPRVSTIQ